VPRREFELAVTHRGEVVGGAGLRLQGPGEADLGYVFRRDAWGRGFATQAARALIRYGFDMLRLHRIWATCDVENGASARVLAKAGMTQEGRLRGHLLRRGAWRDSLLFAILESDRRP
jgi:RimJ/RimL family protein N-acetyltransferase